MIDLKSQKENFESHITHFREESSRLRTGRANSALVEQIQVEAYGAMTPIVHLASISIPDARSILISPWDTSILKDIEKAVTLAQIGGQPVNDGAAIRVTLPALTEENRKNLVKILKERTEKARVSVRGVRDSLRDQIMTEHKNKELTDDDKFELLKKLDDMTREYVDMVEKISATKEQDILSI